MNNLEFINRGFCDLAMLLERGGADEVPAVLTFESEFLLYLQKV